MVRGRKKDAASPRLPIVVAAAAAGWTGVAGACASPLKDPPTAAAKPPMDAVDVALLDVSPPVSTAAATLPMLPNGLASAAPRIGQAVDATAPPANELTVAAAAANPAATPPT